MRRLFLGGVALALSCQRRRQQGGFSDAAFDRDLLLRGVLLLAIDLFWWGRMGLEVLFPFGVGYVLMIGLRRAPRPVLTGLAIAMLAGAEIPLRWARAAFGGDLGALHQALMGTGPRPSWLPGFVFLFNPGRAPLHLTVLYPLIPWLGVLLLGWVYGSTPAGPSTPGPAQTQTSRRLAVAGVAALAVFLLLRMENGYGNMLLPRYDASWVQWLHVSKYPPSLTFLTLQLGLMAVVLAGLLRFEQSRTAPARSWNPFLVFGRTPLFFYVLHLHIMKAFALVFGLQQQLDLPAQYLATAGILVVMYGPCVVYDRAKSGGRWPWLRFL